MHDREELARIIDPEAWADWDRFSSYTNEDGPTDWKEFARRRTTPSLAKADQWLSRPSPVDGLKASLDEASSATMMAEMRADKLMAEVERLKRVTSVSLLSRLSEAEAENARLREALREAEHELVCSSGLRATNLTEEQIAVFTQAGKERSVVEFTIDHTVILARIARALQAKEVQTQ
jgi:hypothetical protein